MGVVLLFQEKKQNQIDKKKSITNRKTAKQEYFFFGSRMFIKEAFQRRLKKEVKNNLLYISSITARKAVEYECISVSSAISLVLNHIVLI